MKIRLKLDGKSGKQDNRTEHSQQHSSGVVQQKREHT